MNRPDFFLVGAPKSATTAMHEYLGQHPEICMARVKELHFFGTDLELLPPGRNFLTIPRSDSELERYLGYFECDGNNKIRGESSVWYLYSEKAAGEIKAFNPDARIIIMLRNPVDLLYSLHCQFLWEGNEDIKDFAFALAAESDRKKGLRLPEAMHYRHGLYYRETVRFHEQVKRYLDLFGKEHVLVLIYEDFVKQPHDVFQSVLQFLNVANDFRPDFKRVNASKKVRSARMMRLLKTPGTIVRLLGKILPVSMRSKLIQRIRKANTVYTPREPMDPELRKQLLQEFKPEIDRLQALLERDLSIWRV